MYRERGIIYNIALKKQIALDWIEFLFDTDAISLILMVSAESIRVIFRLLGVK